MLPQSHLRSKRIAQPLCLGLVFLFLCGFMLFNRSLRVAASTPPHLFTAMQATSPLVATPVISTTVVSATAPSTTLPAAATSLVITQNKSAQIIPVVYDRSFTNNDIIFMPTALSGVAYKLGATKPFDAVGFTQWQAKMPSNICQNTPHYFECTQKRERYLSDGQLGISREPDKLSIVLSENSTVVLTDVVTADGTKWVSYVYNEYLPALHQHHVTIYYYEGANELLINDKTGETTVLPYASPLVSPDHKRFVMASQYYEFQLTVQIWNAQRPRLNLEADMSIEIPPSVGFLQPTKATWVDSTNVRIDTIESASQITGTIMLALTPKGWQASYNGQPIKAPVLSPQSVLNPVSVFAVDTVAVGKRVYSDRTYKFKTVPAVVNGQQYLLFANNNMRNTDADYVHFTPARPATVYVALDIEASEFPGWLKDGWTPTPDILTTDDVVKLRLYKKAFDAGEEVTLGGNWAPPASEIRSHYLVIVAPN
ncbi:MAG: hypothetical protein NT075_34155 [Chloroflexi bacterium]|nr:hypothetical protein [Chloroflexota bacterium]